MTPSAARLLRSKIAKVCISITSGSLAAMMETAATALKDSPLLELRLDALADPTAAPPAIAELLAAHSSAVLLATCRRSGNGGRFQGTVAQEIALLIQAAQTGAQIVDLEVESAEAATASELEGLRASGAALLISHHNFKDTADLKGIYARVQALQPDFLKIVATATTLADNLAMLELIEQSGDRAPMVGLCMGEAGVASRILGLRAGAAFTFAAASAAEPTAPGQLDAQTLLNLYRVQEIDAATKLYGVAGDPVRSSLSPLMLNTAFGREKLNAVYLPLQTSRLPDLLALVDKLRLQGLSVTMPFKQEILPFLEKTDPLSAAIGACNTVLRAPDGKLYGFNTDVAGIVGPLEKRLTLKGARVLVLGAGGAARAAVFGLRDKGADVFILNRTPETAKKLAKQADAGILRKEAVAKTAFDVILNATPSGMAGHPAEPLLEARDLNTKLVFDLVYNPLETPLLQLARRQNIPVITGVEMFVQQGARQFEIWTGKPAPTEEMLRVVLHALRQKAEAAAKPAPRA